MREGDLWPVLWKYWHPVAFSEEVDGSPAAVRLLDERLVLCRLGGQVRAFRDLCVHRGTPISLGWVEGEKVVCAYHGWTYRSDGKCVRIPSIPPDHPIPKKACLTAYPAQERYGLVWVCLAEEPRASIPDFPVFDDPAFRVYVWQRIFWRASAARMIENFVDLAHFPWVHDGVLGNRARTLVPNVQVERHGEELSFSFEAVSSGLYPIPQRRDYRLTRPFAIYNWNEGPPGRVEAYFFVCTPHSAKESTRFLLIARNFDFETPEIIHAPILMKDHEISASIHHADPAAIERIKMATTLADQDRVIVESQRPEELPLNLSEELHLKGPDAVAIEYRRMMKELGVD